MYAYLLIPKTLLVRATRALVWRRPVRVKVIYKSGYVQYVRCTKFSLTKGGTLNSVEWEDAWPEPLVLGVDNVAGVYEV